MIVDPYLSWLLLVFGAFVVLALVSRVRVSSPKPGSSDRTQAMIHVGWLSQYRIHGLDLETERLVLTGDPAADGPTTKVILERTPSFKVQVLSPVKVGAVGQSHRAKLIVKPVPKPEKDGYFAPYTWATILVERNVSVSPEHERIFRSAPTKALTQVSSATADILSRFKLEAQLVAAAITADYPYFVMESWGDMPVYWYAPAKWVTTTEQDIDVVETRAAKPAHLNSLIREVATLVRRDPVEVRQILLAGQALIHARGVPNQTPERFVRLFRSLELLCNIFIPATWSTRKEQFTELATLAASHAPHLTDFVGRLKEIYQSPPLMDRFLELAGRVSAESVETDAKAMKAMIKVRNDFVHGRSTTVPKLTGEYRTFAVMHELSHRYYRLVVDAAAAARPSLG